MDTRSLLEDLKNIYSQLIIYDNKTAMLPVGIDAEFKIDAEKPVKEWLFYNKKDKKEIPPLGLTEVMKTTRQDIAEIWYSITERAGTTQKETSPNTAIDNLKVGGFEISSEPVNSEEEKNRLAREANEKKLAMAAEAEAEEERRNEQKKSVNPKYPSKTPITENHEMFEDRPVEYVEAPAPKKGEVNLLDVFTSICKNDLMQIFGNTGTGKTSICTKLALDSRAKGKSVLYIDTEHNINDDQIEAMQKAGIKYEYIKKFQKICEYIKRLPSLQKYNVVIIDSIGAPALSAFCKSDMRGKGTVLQDLISASDNLKDYATDNDSLVVAINQPESSMNKGEDAILEPFGEKSRYYYKEILKTNYARNGRKTGKTTVVLRAHRSRCMGLDTDVCTMEITSNGVKVIQ